MDPLRWLVPWALLVPLACGPARAPAFLALDRGAAELVTLDRELCTLARNPMPGLSLLATGRVPCVAGAAPGGGEALFVLEGGVPTRLAQAQGIVALASLGEDAWLMLERRGTSATLLWRVSRDAEQRLLGSFEGAQALAARRDEVLVGCSGGSLVRLAPDGALRAVHEGSVSVRALAPGPEPGTWWRLAGDGDGEVALLERDLCARWSVRTGLAATSFAAVEHQQQVWLAAGSWVRGFGQGGVLTEEFELPGGPWQAAAASLTGLVLVSPGALLACERWGGHMRPLRSQGGFRALSALVALAGG